MLEGFVTGYSPDLFLLCFMFIGSWPTMDAVSVSFGCCNKLPPEW